MNNETNSSENKTTFSTWGRVAEEQLGRVSEMMGQSAKLQASAFEQGKELFAYNMKLANDLQDWANETRRQVTGKLFGTK
ncbi:MAG: hypothetical protein GY811_24880 [Myxococcales bacterium]|nr:hypothetical protein [Myxococcales bacterium]